MGLLRACWKEGFRGKITRGSYGFPLCDLGHLCSFVETGQREASDASVVLEIRLQTPATPQVGYAQVSSGADENVFGLKIPGGTLNIKFELAN